MRKIGELMSHNSKVPLPNPKSTAHDFRQL